MTGGILGMLVLRIVTVALFLPFSALDKIFNFSGAVKQSRSIFTSPALATLMILVGLGIEIFTSLAIITGFADRLGAVVLGLYCAATAVLFKQFWRPGDFWSKADGQGRTLFWDFLKNFALGGALLLLAVGPDGSFARKLVNDPLLSTYPYGAMPK